MNVSLPSLQRNSHDVEAYLGTNGKGEKLF